MVAGGTWPSYWISPQEIALFAGSVADNIARFDPDATSDLIVKAAEAAGVHDMIVNLPDGYQTKVGDGRRRTVGRTATANRAGSRPLRRSFPRRSRRAELELDTAGDNALTAAIQSVRARGGIAIVIAHRPSALAAVDKVLAMARGQVAAFGPKSEVLKDVLNRPQEAPAHSTSPGPLAAAGADTRPAARTARVVGAARPTASLRPVSSTPLRCQPRSLRL